MSKSLARALIILLSLILLTLGTALAFYVIKSLNSTSPALIVEATNTDQPTATTESDFSSPSPQPIIQPRPSSSATPTSSTGTPTGTATTTFSPTSEPTNTSSPTVIPTSTATHPPDPDVCARVSVQFRKTTSNIALWQLNNMNFQPARITRISLTWPDQNEAVFNAFLDGVVIWSGGDLVSPTIITDWMGSADEREVLGHTRLEFLFATDAVANGYQITVELDNGCSTSVSN